MIVVCGTAQREPQVRALLDRLHRAGVECAATIDTRNEPTLNHARAWELAATSGPVAGVLEDDVVLSDWRAERIVDDTETLLERFPIVSAYLGRGVPFSKQGRIRDAVHATRDHPYRLLVSRRLGAFSHVALFTRPATATALAADMRAKPGIACDCLVDTHCMRAGYTVAFPVPSWVDHADDGTTVRHLLPVKHLTRVAWVYDGGRWYDSGPTVEL